MITRRQFARGAPLAAAAGLWTESALAQRALVRGNYPPDTVWLNANENPEGPCGAALEAMRGVLGESGRYHFQELREFRAAIARWEGLDPDQVVVGAGSSEVLQIAVQVFTSPALPLIATEPTFELPMAVASALGRRGIGLPLSADYGVDVKRMAEEAGRAGGGLIYLCNPNNPTSVLTPKSQIGWLVSNLPQGTILAIDEAYLHFSTGPEAESALSYVRQGKNVVVVKTFSKIFGMAGLRIGYGCARPELIERMARLQTSMLNIVGMRAALASLAEAASLVPERRGRFAAARADLCQWLKERGLKYLEPQASFVMIDIGRPVREFIGGLLERGVAPGRPFPPLERFLRVSLGTEAQMAKFKRAFWEVYKG